MSKRYRWSFLEGKAPVVSRKESDSSIENTWNVKPKRMTMRQQPSGQSMQARAFASVHTKEEKLPYDIADRVLHTRFGEGTVVAIVEGGRDYEVTVSLTRWELKNVCFLLQN